MLLFFLPNIYRKRIQFYILRRFFVQFVCKYQIMLLYFLLNKSNYIHKLLDIAHKIVYHKIMIIIVQKL